MGLTRVVEIAALSGYISAAVHLPEELPAPVVICCHGMFSCKDAPKYVTMGKVCSGAGIALVRFDFAGCGKTTAQLGADLISSRIRDLNQVMDYVHAQSWSNGLIGLFGSSLGGFISLLAAGSSQIPVTAVVSWAAPYDLHKILLAPEDLNILHNHFPKGFNLGEPSDLRSVISSITRVLVIHGKCDAVVPWSEAVEIYSGAGEPKRLLLMEAAEHRFLDDKYRDLAVLASRDWFAEYLTV